jgi:NlpC/P60 family putative phage cell wall peptidase
VTTRTDIIAAARGWIGMPFRHQGRLKGVGVDCVGLVIGVARELGIADVDHRTYERRPDSHTVARMLARHMRRKPDAARLPGDVLLLAAPLIPCHMGILTERDGTPSLIHAWVTAGRCEEHVLGYWALRIRGVFAFPGVG